MSTYVIALPARSAAIIANAVDHVLRDYRTKEIPLSPEERDPLTEIVAIGHAYRRAAIDSQEGVVKPSAGGLSRPKVECMTIPEALAMFRDNGKPRTRQALSKRARKGNLKGAYQDGSGQWFIPRAVIEAEAAIDEQLITEWNAEEGRITDRDDLVIFRYVRDRVLGKPVGDGMDEYVRILIEEKLAAGADQ